MAKGQSELARRRRAQNDPVDYGKRTRSAYRLLNKLAHWDEELNDKIGMPDNIEEAVLAPLTFFASIAESAKVHLDSFAYSEDEK